MHDQEKDDLSREQVSDLARAKRNMLGEDISVLVYDLRPELVGREAID